LGVGIAIAFLVGGAPDGGAVGLWAAAQLIREWSFGFPHLILHPPGPSVDSARLDQRAGELLGKTGTVLSSLRPMGDADIEGVKMAVSSADGQWIETGTEVTVTAYRNGRPCVTPNS
ncbi:MAG TPA: NfeD family protein, partial [Pirellulales bacterium]|nr:NfeD family protein [Pirellulales bacterium]